MLETLPRIVLDTNVLYAGLYLLRGELKQLALMTRERDKLRVQLSNAQLVIEVQKKVAALLEQLEPLSKFASP